MQAFALILALFEVPCYLQGFTCHLQRGPKGDMSVLLIKVTFSLNLGALEDRLHSTLAISYCLLEPHISIF